MRKALLTMIVLVSAAFAQTTPNLNLNVPTPGSAVNNWGGLLNTNFTILDSALSGGSTVPALHISNPGNFTNTQMNDYFVMSLNGGSTLTEWRRLFSLPNYATEGVAAVSVIPASATVFQHNNVASYIANSSTSVAGVSLYGQCTSILTNSRCWGINTVTSSTAGQPLTLGFYGYENDINVNNATDSVAAELITGSWSAQASFALGIEIAPPTNGHHWTHAFRCDLAATLAPDGNDACLYLAPIASGTNKVSQGLEFVSSDPVSGNNFGAVNLDAGGSLELNTSKAGTGMIINGNFVAQTLNPGGGFYQSKKQVAGCTTASSQGGICASAITVTWPASFADNNYSVTCSGSGAPTNLPSAPYVTAKNVGSATVNYFAITAAAAAWATIDCIAVHD